MGFNVEDFICVEIQKFTFFKFFKILIESSIPHFVLNIIRKAPILLHMTPSNQIQATRYTGGWRGDTVYDTAAMVMAAVIAGLGIVIRVRATSIPGYRHHLVMGQDTLRETLTTSPLLQGQDRTASD